MVRAVGAAATEMLSALLLVAAAGLAESLTSTVKSEAETAVGVPLITPVVAFRDRPPILTFRQKR